MGGAITTVTRRTKKKAKKFDRTFQLSNDTTTMVKHNMNVKKVRVTATTVDGKRYPVKFNIKDNNNIEILNRDDKSIKVTVTEVMGSDKKNFGTELAQYLTRLAISVKSVNVKWRQTQSLSIPQFIPNVGDIFGQNTHYDVMAPGLDFAFGFVGKTISRRPRATDGFLATLLRPRQLSSQDSGVQRRGCG